jgi:hypothetical protein
MPANTSRSTTPVQSLSREEIEKPWKYIGYRGFSAFLASDDDFLIFRRFNTLNVRVFLFLQDRISVLETELNNIDLKHTDKNPVDIHNGSFREDSEPIRTELLLNIHHLLKEYSKCIFRVGSVPLNSSPCTKIHQMHFSFSILISVQGLQC